MKPKNVDDMLDRYADSLKPDETIEMLRPQVRDKVQEYALRRGGWRSRWAVWAIISTGASAAAAVMVFMMTPRDVALQMHVAVAGNAEDLFLRDVEDTPLQNLFWVGVTVDKPCWIHLVERTSNNELIVMYPQASSDEYGVNVENRASLGPYHVVEPNAPGGPSRVTHLIVIISSNLISGEDLASAIPDYLSSGEDDSKVDAAIDSLISVLEKNHDWTVQSVRISSLPDR